MTMDASMVVHQLQKLASDPNPPASVRQKLPRMALGICYFIEHPDVDVKTQAAAAARLLVQKHGMLLCQSKEYADILKALESYIETQSAHPVVKEYCVAAVSILKTQYEKLSDPVYQEELHHAGNQNSTDNNSKNSHNVDTSQNSTPTHHNSPTHHKHIQTTPVYNTNLFSDEPLESLDLFSIVLGLRGILNNETNKEMILQYTNTKTPLVELQRYLQRQIVNVWGVSSATITLNTELLNKQVEGIMKDVIYKEEDSEEGDGIAVVLIRLSRKPQILQKQLSMLREAVGPLTLLLKSSIIQKANYVEPKASPEANTTDTIDTPQYLDSSESLNNPETSPFETFNAQSPGGFSFFSANSYLFGAQSRLEGATIQTYDIDPELSYRLRKEKAKRAEQRMQKMQEEANRGFVSRLFSSFSPSGFW